MEDRRYVWRDEVGDTLHDCRPKGSALVLDAARSTSVSGAVTLPAADKRHRQLDSPSFEHSHGSSLSSSPPCPVAVVVDYLDEGWNGLDLLLMADSSIPRGCASSPSHRSPFSKIESCPVRVPGRTTVVHAGQTRLAHRRYTDDTQPMHVHHLLSSTPSPPTPSPSSILPPRR